MDLSGLLSGLAWPAVSRVMGSLGLGVVSYTGLSAAMSTAVSAAKAAWSGAGADILALLTMAGVFESIAISIGGLTGGLALIAFKRLGLVTTGS